MEGDRGESGDDKVWGIVGMVLLFSLVGGSLFLIASLLIEETIFKYLGFGLLILAAGLALGLNLLKFFFPGAEGEVERIANIFALRSI